MTRKTFTVRTAWFDVISKLSEKEQLSIYRRLFLFHSGRQNEVSLETEGLKIVWNVIKMDLKPNKAENSSTTWKNDFAKYLEDIQEAFNKINNDSEYIDRHQKMYPDVDIKLTLERAYQYYWATKEGWKNKKAKHTTKIDWYKTFSFAISQTFNQVKKSDTQKKQLCQWEITLTGKKRTSSYEQYIKDQSRYGVENVKFISYVK